MKNISVRIVPLGGVVGVTKNMYVYEMYVDQVLQDIMIIDCGIGFPHERELGVDFVIPDITYLLDKVSKIRGIILSHGHEDHIGALPYHYEALGRPPVFASKLTKAFVENKFKESTQRVEIYEVAYDKEYKFGDFTVKFIPITHSIPDCMHSYIKTPIGNFYHGQDFKLDLTPPYGKSPDFYEITKAGKDGILCLLSDCLGSEREGLTLSESIVGQTFEDEMRKTKGMFVMTTFSSNISRIRQCVDAAIKFNRKIVFLGRSMGENSRLATQLGYLPIPHILAATDEDLPKLPPNKICAIVAGSQGQYNSALFKLSHKRNRNIKIKPGDKVIFSSDPIPGNENEVSELIEELSLQGADVIYSDIHDQLHASGHGNQEDLKFLIRFTDPKYFIPIGGTYRHQHQYQKIVDDMGYKKETVFKLNEGETVWFGKNTARLGEKIETQNVYVDAMGVGDVGQVVLRDRKKLSSEGIVVAFVMVDGMGKLVSRPRLMSRGFVLEKNEEKLFDDAVVSVERMMKPSGMPMIDFSALRREIIDTLENYFFEKRGRRPLIVTDIIQI